MCRDRKEHVGGMSYEGRHRRRQDVWYLMLWMLRRAGSQVKGRFKHSRRIPNSGNAHVWQGYEYMCWGWKEHVRGMSYEGQHRRRQNVYYMML